MQPGDHDGEHDDEPSESKPPGPSRFPLTRRSALLGMGAVAGVAAVDVGGFAYAGGWLRPGTPTLLLPSRFADRFEHVYGRHDGFRTINVVRRRAQVEELRQAGSNVVLGAIAQIGGDRVRGLCYQSAQFELAADLQKFLRSGLGGFAHRDFKIKD